MTPTITTVSTILVLLLAPFLQTVQVTTLYGEGLHFRIEGAGTPPDDLRLLMSVGGEARAYDVRVSVQDAGYTGDVTVPLKEGPAAKVSYQWAFGDNERTGLAHVWYEDNGITWEADERAEHDILIAAESTLNADDVTQTLTEALIDAREATSAPYDEQLRVYVYPSPEELTEALEAHEITPSEQITAYAIPREGVIFVSEERWRTDIFHEVAHIVINDNYANVPGWLNEGLALTLQPERTTIDAPERLPLAALCTPNLQSPSEYARAEQTVRYIQSVYPEGTIPQLLLAYDSGAGCMEAVDDILGAGFEQRQQAASTPPSPFIWLAALGISCGLAALFVGPRLRRSQ